ncbi:hypothetical protein LINPERHAP1_LOCUS22583 [Linum perenne]
MIRVWGDPWLHTDENRTIASPPIDGLADMRVNELWIPGTKQWDTELLEELFDEREVETILEIPVGEVGGPDESIWHFSKNRILSVRSAYRVWSDQISTSADLKVDGPWVELWDAHIPPKAKNMA